MIKFNKAKSGQVTRSIVSSNGSKTNTEFYYDHENRLSCVMVDSQITEYYEYNNAGRRTKSTVHANGNTIQLEYSYNNSGQLIEAGDTHYKYDSHGRLIKEIHAIKGVTRYKYRDNHLKTVKLPNGKQIDYVLNNRGQRTAKSVNGQLKEEYIWKNLTQLHAMRSEYGIIKLVYQGTGNPILIHGENAKYQLYVNQVGTPLVLVDSNNQTVRQYSINSFGVNTAAPYQSGSVFFKKVNSSLLPEIPIGFAGGIVDHDTGLVHFGMREYMPEVGRFTTPDPLASDKTAAKSGVRMYFTDPDVYGYCSDDPVNVTDKTGAWSVAELFSGGNTRNNAGTNIDNHIENIKEDPEQMWLNKEGHLTPTTPKKNLKEVHAFHDNATLEAHYQDGSADTYKFTSGRTGVTDQKSQGHGPIPSGKYTLKPNEISEVNDLQYPFRRLNGDWGHGRVPLHPQEDTKTHGRSGFYIPGGDTPGSAGCIDIGSKDRDFFKKVNKQGVPLKVTVY
ncbi:MAG: RHS repeat-associated core domain-containing protein [Desulfovibrio sp.]